MKQIILIGNGFDLAHGLKTSYSDFMDDYWKNIKNVLIHQIDNNRPLSIVNYKDENIEIAFNLSEIDEHLNVKSLSFSHWDRLLQDLKDVIKINSPLSYREQIDSILTRKFNLESHNFKFTILNQFIADLDMEKNICKWVDIEYYYFKQLKKVHEKSTNRTITNNLNKLNGFFSSLGQKLEVYIQNQMIFNKTSLKKINFQDFIGNKNPIIDTSLSIIANFNYTNTPEFYFSKSNIINIHGQVNDPANPIVFGYGDETDLAYEKLEYENDNEFLRHFKNFAYIQNNNYRKLLTFLNQSGGYEVLILGHSCGLSDRVMLKTIFEHKNCINIRVAYHINQEGKDNFTELAMNISRHFNDKAEFRRKLIGKTGCFRMPQWDDKE